MGTIFVAWQRYCKVIQLADRTDFARNTMSRLLLLNISRLPRRLCSAWILPIAEGLLSIENTENRHRKRLFKAARTFRCPSGSPHRLDGRSNGYIGSAFIQVQQLVQD